MLWWYGVVCVYYGVYVEVRGHLWEVSLSYILVGSGNQTPAVKNSGSQSHCTGSGLHSLPCGILHVSHVSCIRELLSSNVMGKWFLTISSCSAPERMMTWSGAVESWHWNGTPVFHGGVHNPKDLIAFENSPSHWRQAWNEFPFTISVWRKTLTCFPLDRHWLSWSGPVRNWGSYELEQMLIPSRTVTCSIIPEHLSDLLALEFHFFHRKLLSFPLSSWALSVITILSV